MRISNDLVSFVIIGLGGRGSVYLNALTENFKNNFKLNALCEPNKEKQKLIKDKYPDAKIFDYDMDIVKEDRLSDVAIVSTQDRLHKDITIELLKKGYDIILEKPISTNLEEVVEIYKEAKKYPNQIVAVCHVLRDTIFFNKLKDIVQSKEFGKVITIQHNENIGYYHFAHSYVRGEWRDSQTSAPITVTKSCHDMDILLYLLGDKDAQKVASFGSLSHFTSENFKKDCMSEYCVNCKIEKNCPYSAVKIYSGDLIKTAVFDKSSLDKIKEQLSNSQYGRCVYNCDNNVCDHHSSIIEFDDGITATFNISAFTGKINRSIKIMCEYGEIRGIEKPYMIETTNFLTGEVNQIELPITERGHGGGDNGFIKNFMKSYIKNEPFSTSIEKSVQSHVMAFLAEKSRIEGGTPQSISRFMENLVNHE